MALTKQSELRRRVYLAMAELPDAAGSKAQVLQRMDEIFGQLWSPDDFSFMPSNGEMRWRNRTAQERRRMVHEGLLSNSQFDYWMLTDSGRVAANEALADERARTGSLAAWLENERDRRDALWSSATAGVSRRELEPSSLNGLRIFRGGRGVYVDQENTRSSYSPYGAAVGLLHTGTSYRDELAEDGVTYHYPNTSQTGRDQTEVEAIRSTFALGLPIFVISPGPKGNLRTLHRGYIEDVDNENQVVLVTFTDGAVPPPPPPSNDHDTAPFGLTDEDPETIWQKRRGRPNQRRFAFGVSKRYGNACAVCDLAVPGTVQAAHLKPKSQFGADDPRNGLPLCANHHLMFDARLWAIEPATGTVVTRPAGPTRNDLHITRASLDHLSASPHAEALQHVWESWTTD